jgi:very-short-patch-repair endonuclease
MKVCKYCDKEIEGNHSIFANHVRWCDKNLTNGDKGVENNKSVKIKNFEKRFGKDKEFDVKCHKCSNIFKIIEPEFKFPTKVKYYCSRSCSNTRNHSSETKKLISEKNKLVWLDEDYANRVITNNTNKNKRFTSKGEEEIRNYFISKFTNDEWTFGGGFKYEDYILTRDLYSKKLKVIFEYDGVWHFKDIHGQLDMKQKKDSKLEKWVVENGWRLIRIKEELYKSNKNLYLDLIEFSIYKSDEQIIKIY